MALFLDETFLSKNICQDVSLVDYRTDVVSGDQCFHSSIINETKACIIMQIFDTVHPHFSA